MNAFIIRNNYALLDHFSLAIKQTQWDVFV